MSGNGIHVENFNVTVKNGLAFFNGHSRLVLPRFANLDYQDLVIYVKFRDEPSHRFQALVSNGDCCKHMASMALIKSKHNVHFMAKTDEKKVTTFHLPLQVSVITNVK